MNPPNGTPVAAMPVLQFQVANPQPGVQLIAFIHGQLCSQTQMTLDDADKFCKAWRDAIDKARSPIAIVGPGDLPAGVKLKG